MNKGRASFGRGREVMNNTKAEQMNRELGSSTSLQKLRMNEVRKDEDMVEA